MDYGLVGARRVCVGDIFCVGRAAHLALPSTEWTAYLLARARHVCEVGGFSRRRRRLTFWGRTAACWRSVQVSTVGFKMDTSVFWASNMFIRPAFLLPQPPHHLKNI